LKYTSALILRGCPGSTAQTGRIRSRGQFLEIAGAPGQRYSYTETDGKGRPVDINICGPFAIKYWTDHADRQIKILDVHAADRSR
jgi:hypothetical protein